MPGELEGKVAIVTGGAMGIGRATAELFVAEGAKLVLADKNEALATEVADALGPNAAFCKADISRQDDVQALVDFAVERFGGLHVMCNNAALASRTERFLEDDVAGWEKYFAINVLGTGYGCQAAARHMAGNGGGSVINTSSVAGVMPGLGYIPYRASNAAVVSVTKSLAIDLAEFGVRVNAIVPGNVRTTIMDYREPDMTDEDFTRVRAATDGVMREYQPLKRHTLPEDVAQASLYLASDRSRQVTGILLPVDGGITAGDVIDRPGRITEARQAVLREIRAERARIS